MSETSAAPLAVSSRGWNIVRRILMILLLAFLIGWALHHLSRALERGSGPAGFAQGLLQGALMPASFPNLLVGNDVTIYAARNTGLTYKLGYTMGVNVCGLIFFGLSFRRLSRWKRDPK